VASAKGGSDDPSARRTRGSRLGSARCRWCIPSNHGVQPARTGQLSKPVRTRFGYHIIKVWHNVALRVASEGGFTS